MKNLWYLFSAYMVIWILIFGYLLKINSKLKSLTLKVDSLESEIKE
ncbi:CcmD family protein [Deferribacter autotrophicus]|uniref:CcmD family protein n=1 Tax=Deferribacter autotrophicus TaxID=500465 RepID=A0A5A8F646_9BACT|nr:CcmD family protein [Deferribacter autotrophicus]KAA0258883.1 CcmD family protein [Deferribacter autotrophicus]